MMEVTIRELLSGDLMETALGFAAELNSRQLTPRQWFGPQYWRIPYGEDYLCGIVINPNRWRIWFFSGDYSGEISKKCAKIVQENVGHCISCSDDCPRGQTMRIFGMDFENACFQFPIQFENPQGCALDCAKELIEYWKGIAPRSDSWHVR